MFCRFRSNCKKTDNVLSDLSEWLGLKIVLDSKYKIFKNTGKAVFGDPSDNIKSGKIIKTNDYKEIEIPSEILC